MTHDVYVKADDIYKKIANLRKLHRIANESYKRFILSKKFLWISTYKEDEAILYDKTEAVLYDKGLTKLIEEYCKKQIEELQEELKSL